MATSGSINFTQTRNEIINDAMQLIGVYGVGRTISSEDMTFAASMLNKMVKAWQAQGIHLWAREEGYLFTADNTGTYTLSSASGSARATKRNDAVLTELSVAGTSGNTSITVDSTTDMAASDIIGVVNDDDTVTWSTIASVDSSTTLTMDDGLDGDCAIDSNVYTFTSRINKPLRLHGMRRVEGISSPTSIPMVKLSQREYFDLPNKNTNGLPTQFYYNPDLDDGTLYLWPRPNDPEMYFEISYDRMLEDFDGADDNADFPQEWLEAITYQLAYRLAPAFGKDKNMLQPEASALLRNMLDWDTEVTSIYLQPNMRGR